MRKIRKDLVLSYDVPNETEISYVSWWWRTTVIRCSRYRLHYTCTTKLRIFWFRLMVYLRHLLNFVVLLHLGFNYTGIVSYFYWDLLHRDSKLRYFCGDLLQRDSKWRYFCWDSYIPHKHKSDFTCATAKARLLEKFRQHLQLLKKFNAQHGRNQRLQ